MEKRQNTKLLIPLPIQPSGREECPPLHMRELQQVGDHVVMAQTNPLRQARRAGAVHQKRQVPLRIDPRPRVPPGIARPPDTPVVPRRPPRGGARVPPLLADQYDPPLPYPGPAAGLPRRLEVPRLRHQRPGPAVLELPRQLVDRVQRVRRAHGAAGPEAAHGHDRGVDRVWCVEGEHVALLPAPAGLQALAEVVGGIADRGVGVGPGGAGVGEDGFGVGEGFEGPLEEEGPEVDFWQGDGGEGGRVRHCGGDEGW
jgi:hypothetical protein